MLFTNLIVLSIIYFAIGFSETDVRFQPTETATYYEYSGVLTQKAIDDLSRVSMARGHIIIDNTVNISNKEIGMFLGRSLSLAGSLTIRNTSLKTFELGLRIKPINDSVTLRVENNEILKKMEIYGSFERFAHAVFSNNPILNYEQMCNKLKEIFSQFFKILDKPHVCGCMMTNEKLSVSMEELPDNCTVLIGNITITADDQPHYEVLQQKFSFVKTIHGIISVVNSTYTDLGFLKSVEEVSLPPPSSNANRQLIEVKGNKQLTRLRWDSLVRTDYIYILIEQLRRISEHQLGVSSNAGGKILAKLCEDQELSKDIFIIRNNSLEGIENSYTVLVGDLTIDENFDISKFIKLSRITKIYGHLKIRNSALLSNNWLQDLEFVHSFTDKEPTILVENNTSLRIFEILPNLLRQGSIVIRNNRRLKLTHRVCEYFSDIDVISGNSRNCGSANTESSATEIYSTKATMVLLVFMGLQVKLCM